MGYCGKGSQCPARHVHECPDYANKGSCPNKKCHLPHIDRAGQIKKHAAAAHDVIRATSSAEDEDSDLVSDNGDSSEDDVDSDGIEEMMDFDGDDDTASHAISEQQDYVHF